MTISPGTKLGSYEILSLLGVGGMGEVYRARDTKLGRDVAVKVLPDGLAAEGDRFVRFKREAQTLATLNHPGIAAIYGLEESQERTALVLELVEGETLADRLRSGPIPWREALPIAKQIAEALEAAHARGIMHRDLKPANIKITPDGKVKVLDFGLAKVFTEPAEDVSLSHSPTLMTGGSMTGMILGTAAYMSPEQARGKAVDKRTDIWALGTVLFEMLSGRHAFPGDSVSEILAEVIKGEPDWTSFPSDVPRRIRDLVQRCLRKDAHQRVHDAADVRIEIDDALAQPDKTEPAIARNNSALLRLASIFLPLFGGAIFSTLGWWLYARSSASSQEVLHLAVHVAEEMPNIYDNDPWLIISPDGNKIVYAVLRGGTTQLMLRKLGDSQATLIPGTEGAQNPFFSPDSQWVAFRLSRELKKVPITGGSPVTICDDTSLGVVGLEYLGASDWGPDGRIVFAPHFRGDLWSISADGSRTELLLKADMEKDWVVYSYPQILPDGKGVLLTIGSGHMTDFDEAQIAVLEPGAREPRVVLHGATAGRYLPTGHLVYAHAGELLAVRFDLSRLEPVGTPVPVVHDVPFHPGTGAAKYGVSNNGTLVYIPGPVIKGDSSLVSIDRKGNVATISRTPSYFADPAVSSDGKRAIVRIFAANDDLWTMDTSQGNVLRLTTQPGDELRPVLTHDNSHVAYMRDFFGPHKIFWKAVDGTGEEEELSSGPYSRYPGSFSRDDKTLALVEAHPTTKRDILLMSISDRKTQAFQVTNAEEFDPKFSPNGKWIAYVSDETRRNEIYIKPVTTAGARIPISSDGGVSPVWSRKGNEIFYLNGKKLMSATIDPQTGTVGRVNIVVELKFPPINDIFDVMTDDEHFLMAITPDHQSPNHFNIVVNWFEELQKLVPVSD